MEVKCVKREIKPKVIDIYINNYLWKSVYGPYFSRLLVALIKEEGFKEKFVDKERKKLIEVSFSLLARRSYLIAEWKKKMIVKLFDKSLVDRVFEEDLSSYFDEEEEVKRRVEIYAARGKGRAWIEMKMSREISIDQRVFNDLLNEFCSNELSVEKIIEMINSKRVFQEKPRDKIVNFFLRRGYSYQDIKEALKAIQSS